MNPNHNGSSHRHSIQNTPVKHTVLNSSTRLQEEEQAPEGEQLQDFTPATSKAAYYRKWTLILFAGLLVAFGLSAVSSLWQGEPDVNDPTVPSETVVP